MKGDGIGRGKVIKRSRYDGGDIKDNKDDNGNVKNGARNVVSLRFFDYFKGTLADIHFTLNRPHPKNQLP